LLVQPFGAKPTHYFTKIVFKMIFELDPFGQTLLYPVTFGFGPEVFVNPHPFRAHFVFNECSYDFA
jgi:hypothetical protein